MAVSHVPITGTEHGAWLKRYIAALRTVITEGPLIESKMGKMIDGSDYSHLETQFGLDVGTGASAYGELQAVVLALQADPANEASTAGNAAKLATKLRQFVDVVG